MPTSTPTRTGQLGTRQGPRVRVADRLRSGWLVEVYRSALGKKYAMAISGIFLMAWITAHLIGNLKIYVGPEAFDFYSEWLREGLGYPLLPRAWLLWGVRVALIGAFAVHIHAAYGLTVVNRRARPDRYRSKRDYVAASFAARTMRWTGIIVGLFVIYHLLDLTYGVANPGGRQQPHLDTVQSLRRWPVAVFYVLGNLALGYHLYHGAWSLFQSMGWNRPRFNRWRRTFATVFAVVIAGGFISFPVAAALGVVS